MRNYGRLIDPYFINGTLDGQKQRNFPNKDLTVWLQDLQTMWFQHNGCPDQYHDHESLNRDYIDC